MAGVHRAFCFALVLFSVQQVIGKECNSNIRNIFNCDECIRCGGYWCNQPAPESSADLFNIQTKAQHSSSKDGGNKPSTSKGTKDRCTSEPNSGWCPHGDEVLGISDDNIVLGNPISPISIQTSAIGGSTKTVQVYYAATVEQKAHIKITQGKESDLTLKYSTQCSKGNCTLTIDASTKDDLCSTNGSASVHFNVRLTVDTIDEDVVIQYKVPCGCKCSERTELSSKMCNGRGDYSCGTCTCHSGWTGDACDLCPDRGDLDVTCQHSGSGLECSGNGVCDPCGNCVCDMSKPGSQYFDVQDKCSDLCYFINTRCDICLLETPKQNEKVQCQEQNCEKLFLIPYNKTEASDRSIWVTCNDTSRDRVNEISYFTVYEASKQEGKIFVMIKRHWNSDSNEVIVAGKITSAVQITVPAIIGILGLVAATAAVAGYMVWKNRSPPLPLMDPSYQNIGAEDCTGVNPLYKPPNTTFINPTYRK